MPPRSAASWPLYSPSALTAVPVTTTNTRLPSTMVSFKPVTVTVCATFQLADVNVSAVVLRETSSALVGAEIDMVTSAVGASLSTIVKVAEPPASVTLPVRGPTITSGTEKR